MKTYHLGTAYRYCAECKNCKFARFYSDIFWCDLPPDKKYWYNNKKIQPIDQDEIFRL